ncbi:MAG TPA: MBL fold metallo-hydrolase, partial [Armatimonadota bacterium]
MFTLEALNALYGDSLLLRYGTHQVILIDGGPDTVYSQTLQPRLLRLRREWNLAADQPLPIRLVVVSHLDDDHILGILDLSINVKDEGNTARLQINDCWCNTFDDVLTNAVPHVQADCASMGMPLPTTASCMASVGQGRALRDAMRKLLSPIPLNRPFAPLVMASGTGPVKYDLDGEITLYVIGPLQTEVAALQKDWQAKSAKL